MFWNDPLGDEFGVSDELISRLVMLQNYYEDTPMGDLYGGYIGNLPGGTDYINAVYTALAAGGQAALHSGQLGILKRAIVDWYQ